MAYSLVIVESPAKCKKIEDYLGPGYRCMASFGHLRALKNLKSIDMANEFNPTFHLVENKSQQISKLRKAIQGAGEIILAADDDREGEAIAWHICQIFNLPVTTTKRIIFHEVTKTALQKAITQPTILNMDIVHAQQARQILDLIVGFTLSPILWDKISYKTKTGLSAGRCQTPALRLVYDNQKEIDASPGKKVYQTTGYFTAKNVPFALQYNHDSEDSVSEFLENSVEFEHVYSCGKIRPTTKQPPSPFTTSTLQQMASNELHFSPKDTMRLCQTLYEGGYITYMRTDSKTYSKDFVATALDYIGKTYGGDYECGNINILTERNTKDKKSQGKAKANAKDKEVSAQEAHEAIRPTNVCNKVVPDAVGKREMRLYALIWRNTVESCMASAKYSGVTASITAANNNEYRHSTEQVVFPGWKAVAGFEEVNALFNYFQTLKKGAIINYKKVTAKVSMKELKTHYTEAKLVQLLEQKGIGRPSTFSSLIDKIQERNYVKKMNVEGKNIKCVDFELEGDELSEIETERVFGNEKNKLVVRPLGTIVVEFLIKHFNELFQYEYTKQMEDDLDNIAKGNKVWHTLCEKCNDEIAELSKDLVKLDKLKIVLDDKHTYMIGKFGPIIKCSEEGGKSTFKRVCEDIDIDKLRRGEYALEEIIAKSTNKDIVLGEYKKTEIVLKEGKYGKYIRYKTRNISAVAEGDAEITLEDAIKLIEGNHSCGGAKKSSIIRTIDDQTSIRKGKFGDYVFYKKPEWTKPKFIKLFSFVKENGKDSYKTCDVRKLKTWLQNNA